MTGDRTIARRNSRGQAMLTGPVMRSCVATASEYLLAGCTRRRPLGLSRSAYRPSASRDHHRICDQLRLGVPKVCLDQIDFEVGKRCKYLINKTRI